MRVEALRHDLSRVGRLSLFVCWALARAVSATAQESPTGLERPDSLLATPPAPGSTSVADSLALIADERLRNGFTVTTARELSRRLSSDPDIAGPELILLTARAHAEAGSWVAVRRLLSERDWLDEHAQGRLLLARASLALDDPLDAAKQYAAAGDERLSVEDRVGYARALRSLQRYEEAAAQFELAAAADSTLAGWLALSAVQTWAEGGRPESASRAADGLRDRTEVWTDSTYVELALAYFVAGDSARGVALSDSLSPRARARLSADWILPALLAAGDSAGALRDAESALRYAGVGSGVTEFLASLDGSPDRLRRIASAELREGRVERAVEYLERALAGARGDEAAAITLELAEAVFANGQYADVGRVLAAWIDVRDSAETRALSERVESEMRFLVGRALYRSGRRARAAEQWRLVAADPTAPDGPRAAWLLADLEHDRARLPQARSAYEETVERFPRSAWAGRAIVRLGLLDMLEGRPRDAVARFDSYRRRFPGGGWFEASTFWSARAREMAGDSTGARVLYRQVLGGDPLGYYGIQSARALGEEAWDHVRWRAMPSPRLRPDHAELVRRMARLRDLGWKPRALRELSARQRRGETREDRLALAIALNAAGFSWQGTSLAWEVFRARDGVWSEELLRAVYPLVYHEILQARAEAEDLDPSLLAALIRRESQFDRDVVSSAGATGLMQLLPSTGAELARRTGIRDFRPEQLTVPELNLWLGTRYLRDLLERRGGALIPALISYNAGPHRYAAWRRFPEFSSGTELMIDRIPFTETRLYVKAILSYRYIYERLYRLGSSSG